MTARGHDWELTAAKWAESNSGRRDLCRRAVDSVRDLVRPSETASLGIGLDNILGDRPSLGVCMGVWHDSMAESKTPELVSGDISLLDRHLMGGGPRGNRVDPENEVDTGTVRMA